MYWPQNSLYCKLACQLRKAKPNCTRRFFTSSKSIHLLLAFIFLIFAIVTIGVTGDIGVHNQGLRGGPSIAWRKSLGRYRMHRRGGASCGQPEAPCLAVPRQAAASLLLYENKITKKTNLLKVALISWPMQPNASDCGLLASAFAFEWVKGCTT